MPTREAVETPYTNPYEILDMLREQYNQQPVTYTTGPRGNLIATKSMAKPELPSEMARYPQFHKYFGEGDLTTKWIIPKPTGPITYAPPASDAMRQGDYNYGVSNVGPRASYLSPSYFPSSAFNVPMRGASGKLGSRPTPEFGSTIDYSTGRFYTAPGFGSYNMPYGTFDARRKTSPTFPSPMFPSGAAKQSARYRLGRRKTKGTRAQKLSGLGGVYA